MRLPTLPSFTLPPVLLTAQSGRLVFAGLVAASILVVGLTAMAALNNIRSQGDSFKYAADRIDRLFAFSYALNQATREVRNVVIEHEQAEITKRIGMINAHLNEMDALVGNLKTVTTNNRQLQSVLKMKDLVQRYRGEMVFVLDLARANDDFPAYRAIMNRLAPVSIDLRRAIEHLRGLNNAEIVAAHAEVNRQSRVSILLVAAAMMSGLLGALGLYLIAKPAEVPATDADAEANDDAPPAKR